MSLLAHRPDAIGWYDTRSGFILYARSLVVGALALVYAGSLTQEVFAGPGVGSAPTRMKLAAGIGAACLGLAGVRQWRRVKWVRTSDRGGIEWSAGGRHHHRAWGQLTNVDLFTSVWSINGAESSRRVRQTLTVTFVDGARFRVVDRDMPQWVELALYLQTKTEHLNSDARGAASAAAHTAAGREAAGQTTQYGPLTITKYGLEWQGVFTPWEQIEGYEVQHGFLLVRTADGNEFLKRLSDLGDWREALEKLEAAAERMGRPVDEHRTRGERKRQFQRHRLD